MDRGPKTGRAFYGPPGPADEDADDDVLQIEEGLDRGPEGLSPVYALSQLSVAIIETWEAATRLADLLLEGGDVFAGIADHVEAVALRALIAAREILPPGAEHAK